MSRYDFRVRRQLFRSGNLEKYKDFRALEKEYTSRRRFQRLVRLLLVLLALILLIVTITFTVSAKGISDTTPHDLEVKVTYSSERL